jgi:4-hydroxy-2-oxoglutarate aldolase
MTRQLRGIIGPVISTFRADGDLDLDAFGENLRTHMASGLAGIAIAGSTGEAALLDEGERMRLVEMARPIVPDDRWLIVGTGAESTRAAIRLTKQAAERGADAGLVVAPHYYGSLMTDAAVLAHYRAVADASPIPVIIYNMPKYMHFSIAAPVMHELARHENVIGTKDSSGKLETLASFLEVQSDTFSVLVGNGAVLQSGMERGARGGILTVSLFAPAATLEVYSAMERGDVDTARRLQERLTPVHARIVGELGIPAIKHAMDVAGLRGGAVRSPLQPLASELRAEVDALVQSLTPVAV